MDHHVEGIDDGPTRVVAFVYAEDFHLVLLERMVEVALQGLQMRVGIGRRQYQKVGDRGLGAHIEDRYVGRLGIVQRLAADSD